MFNSFNYKDLAIIRKKQKKSKFLCQEIFKDIVFYRNHTINLGKFVMLIYKQSSYHHLTSFYNFWRSSFCCFGIFYLFYECASFTVINDCSFRGKLKEFKEA